MSRDVEASPIVSDAATPLAPYSPRHFRALGLREVGDIQLKVYSLRLGPEPLDASVIHAGEMYIQRTLAESAAEEGDHHNLGFAILHEGTVATWLLLHWWAHADILCQRMAYTADDGSFVDTDRPFHGCVWEGVVFTHEHRAWVETMLTASPDPDAYLRHVLPDGRY